ncbi:MAG TPA: FAD-dependent oxidoreductase [Dongiaceae bacterium]|nr:FAD-dependent oxidoreductase [Dongiaceae bacterium]
MPREPRFDPLFAPLRIGPVTAPNRFYQVPHCTGMGYGRPQTLAAMRAVKAEGGWSVVCTEYCSIHPTSDDHPAPYASLWDQGDVRNLAILAEGVHRHGSLAGVELWHGGLRSANLHSRQPPMGPQSLLAEAAPVQSRRMDKTDLLDYRRAHRAAASRAKEAGFDIVYVYASHGYLLSQFLDDRLNRHLDGYSGSLENRLRLVSELIDETKEAVGDRCAVAIRIEVDTETTPGEDPKTAAHPHGERRAIFELLKDAPDLFDVTVVDYSHEMGASRFIKEASLEPLIAHVRGIVQRPVVSVGRFTSPETMLGQVKRGVVDLIGAARPSIADPFLPQKIAEGRLDDIRECIGCNICYASNSQGVPLRCTQNPTMGEEWRRGWHPERIERTSQPARVLVVGAGPAGLEAALTLGRRGHQVMLAEARRDLGGRVALESRLPGLGEWGRVRDYRQHQLGKLDNVEVFRESRMSAADIREIGARHVLLATGSSWRRDGMGHHFPAGNPALDGALTLTPDDIMAGQRPREKSQPVIVYDDDHYVMAAVIAELLAREGHTVTYVTTAGLVGEWSRFTGEQPRSQARLLELGVEIVVSQAVDAIIGDDPSSAQAELACVYTGRRRVIACGGFVPVTSREPNDVLWHELTTDPAGNAAAGIAGIQRIGDCKAPGLIAHAVYDGHRIARMIDGDQLTPDDFAAEPGFGRDRLILA